MVLLTSMNEDKSELVHHLIIIFFDHRNNMVKMLDETFGLQRAMMTTVHAYTADQPLADVAGADLRRSRSAVENIIPNTTQSPELVQKILPQFKGKIEGIAFNVPVPNGSCVDLTTELDRTPTIEQTNQVIKEFSENKLKGIVGYTSEIFSITTNTQAISIIWIILFLMFLYTIRNSR